MVYGLRSTVYLARKRLVAPIFLTLTIALLSAQCKAIADDAITIVEEEVCVESIVFTDSEGNLLPVPENDALSNALKTSWTSNPPLIAHESGALSNGSLTFDDKSAHLLFDPASAPSQLLLTASAISATSISTALISTRLLAHIQQSFMLRLEAQYQLLCK